MKNLTFVILLLTSLTHSQSYPPNDPYWSTQGWLTAMKVDYFWQQSNTFGDTNVVIAVMGLGVEITHEDLSDNIWINWNEIPNNGIDDDGNGYIDDYNGWNVINLTGNIMPDQINDGYAHETNVSGIISAKMNNNKGIVGIAPNCKILPVKFYDFGQSNSWKAEKLILAFNYVRDLQIQFPEKRFIINLSYGFTSFSPSERMLVSNAIEECYNLNIPIFCAAGNSPEPVEFPANLPFTASVSELRPGISNLFNLPGYNNIGPENNFAAAGTALFTTSDNNTYDGFNGTSMASPIAAGIAALLLSVRNDLTPAQIDTIMKLTSEQVGDVDYYWNPDLPGHSQELGYGKLNAEYCLTRGLLDINFANNVEGNTNNFGQIKINDQWQPTNTTLPFILNDEITLEAENVLHNYNNYDNRFYNWSVVFNPAYSRNLNNIIVADYELQAVHSLYKKTNPLTVRNYLEGGDGGIIKFGESGIGALLNDFIDRGSPFQENAFLYNQLGQVLINYKAEAKQTHNLLNTTWRFYRWENGSANRIREEQINLSSQSEWKAIYKGIQRSDNSAAHSSNSQRKSVRTPNGQLANIYESLGTIWMENSTDNGQSWFILNNANPFVSEPSVNPAIDYFPWSSTHSSLAAVYYPHGILKMKVMKTNGTIDYNAVLPWDPGNGYPVVPSVAVSSNRILVVSTGGINGQNGLVYFYGTVQQSPFNVNWTQYNVILPGTGQSSSNPTIAANKSAGNIFHIAWQEGSSIKYCKATGSGNNLTFEPVETPSTLSGYQKHLNPSISLVNGYPILSWTGVQYAGLEKVLIKDNDGTTGYQRALIRRKGPQGWGDTQVVGGNQVNFTNNNSVTAAQDKTVIVWSEGTTNPQSKWIKRTGSVYSIPANLSHSGIQTQVINGSDYQFMTSIVFNNNQQPYYFIKTTTDFNEERSGGGELGKVQIESDSSVTFGRAGIVSINGVEFIFNTGDVVVDNSVIAFTEKPDTTEYISYSDLNQYTRTENFQLNGSSQFYFSNLYYVLNKELADTSLDETQSVNFKVELVNSNTNQSAGTFDDITYNKYNLEKYDNISYQVNCSGIEPGEYYLRLITTVNTEAEYSLANLMNSSEELEKKHYTEVNYAGNQIPDSYDLAQNYPNPFNPSTTIRYQLPQDGMVTLKVYDILGSEVATLVNEQKSAGRYEANFDASRLASGVYIYKLKSGEYLSSKKMLLLK